MNIQTISRAIVLTGCLMTAFGCSSSGGSGTGNPDINTPTTSTISGSVFAGPTNGAAVTVKKADGSIVAGPIASNADGNYSIAVPNSALTSDLIFEATGGTYTDEAAPAGPVTLGTLAAHVAGGSLASGANVTIDPGSTIIRRLLAGGMTRTAAETAFSNAFGYMPNVSVKPAFTTMSTASTMPQRLAGVRAAAFSQMTKNMGLAADKQMELIRALADDLADGTLDGKGKDGQAVSIVTGTQLPEDAGNRFNDALLGFQSSLLNKSRLTTDKLGPILFNKKATTASYRMEYLPGTAPAAMGKSSFKIKLTNKSDSSPAPGKTLAIRPFMFMATKSHTTPYDTVVDNGDGTYSCTVYHVMASTANGMSMGLWQLKVSVGGEEASFYPEVAAISGTTPLTKLTGITDSIAGPEKRTWFLFSDGLTAGTTAGTFNFGFFLATKETLENFPAVKTGDQLKDQNGTPWTVNTIVAEVSTDATNWKPATHTGNGHWTAAGLTGLTAGTAGKVYLKLTVNGEQKTTNGSALAADGSNGYQTFTLMPGA